MGDPLAAAREVLADYDSAQRTIDDSAYHDNYTDAERARTRMARMHPVLALNLRSLATALEREREAHEETREMAEPLAEYACAELCVLGPLPDGADPIMPGCTGCPVARFRAANPKEK